MSQDDVIEIPSDDESDRDDLGDGRDTWFDLTLGSGNADSNEPSVIGGTGPDSDISTTVDPAPISRRLLNL